jgi:dTDP-4-amino-4,6-dideoxy-D-galactose acyltransferase
MTEPAAEPCTFLAWDSDFFGFSVARVNAHRLTPRSNEQISEWCHAHAIRCLYFLADADDGETIDTAEANGYHFVDIRLTFERKLENGSPLTDINPNIRPCQDENLPALKKIARDIHTDTRFFFDPQFPREKAAHLYEIWLEKTHRSEKDIVLVGHENGQAHSYITCVLDGDGRGEIGLVGVGESHQGIGMGGKLVGAALDLFARRHVSYVRVVTQGRNTRAQRLYQRAGFVTGAIQLWFHRWF